MLKFASVSPNARLLGTLRSIRSRKCISNHSDEKPIEGSPRFDTGFEQVRMELLSSYKDMGIGSMAIQRLDQVMTGNCNSGKLIRGTTLVNSYKMLMAGKESAKDLRIAHKIGWAQELIQSSYLIFDDIMDQSLTRRGKACWYLQEGVNLMAHNDGLLLENAAYELLRLHIRDKPYYIPMLELSLEAERLTKMGQCLDLLSNPNGKGPNFDMFTVEIFEATAKYKTSVQTCSLPVRAALYLAGIDDPVIHQKADSVLMELGVFYQAQNDIADCFADASITGRVGNDIEEGKCTWLLVTALEIATYAQRVLLKENYGKQNSINVGLVKDVYKELDIQSRYKEYEKKTYNETCDRVKRVVESTRLPAPMFDQLVSKIFKTYKK